MNPLEEIVSLAKGILEDEVNYDGKSYGDVLDIIPKIADKCVPVYYNQILELARYDITIALTIPEV